jgi:hypothetical protein
MSVQSLASAVNSARCRVLGWEDAENDVQRSVLTALIRGLDHAQSGVLCEPSLVRSTHRPPDVVLVCPVAGIHVIEVKGIALSDIAALEPGGQFVIQYQSGARSRNPFAQVRHALFDVRDAVQRSYEGELTVPFRYWVILPRISRRDWMARWGQDCLCPPELLFLEDLPGLADRLQRWGLERLRKASAESWPGDELIAVWRAFGDTSVLYPAAEERVVRHVREATLGEMFDEAAEIYKSLSDEQQRLSSQNWEQGPRLVRGVAGSGKTIVAANNLARMAQRMLSRTPSLFEETSPPPRILAVCFNRALVPYLRKRIELAFQQRTGRWLPDGIVDVSAYNSLMYSMSRQGLWRYQSVKSENNSDAEARARAAQYLADLQATQQADPSLCQRLLYDAIYVDEGQDFLEEDYVLLKHLCRHNADREPNLCVFYDDAQNLYGRSRPNWQAIGLKMIGGRSHVMTECFRNTRQIVEPAFNVLYGTFATRKESLPTRAFGDLATLQQRDALEYRDHRWHLHFAKREGLLPRTTVVASLKDELAAIVNRLRWLIVEQEVRPQDILVLALTNRRLDELEAAIAAAAIPGIETLHHTARDKDALLVRRGQLTLSTVHSAKGYDAYCVLLASAHDCAADVSGRATFYVACTRAIEYLELFGLEAPGSLLEEMQAALA